MIDRDISPDELYDEETATVPFLEYRRLEMKLDHAQDILVSLEDLLPESLSEEAYKKLEELSNAIRY